MITSPDNEKLKLVRKLRQKKHRQKAGLFVTEGEDLLNAGLAAGRNTRAYLIQTYARDMGNGNTVMMREIDVPVRVRGKHWGGFRTAYRL